MNNYMNLTTTLRMFAAGDCQWITKGGAHLCIGNDGSIAKGPKGLVGKNIKDAGARKASGTSQDKIQQEMKKWAKIRDHARAGSATWYKAADKVEQLAKTLPKDPAKEREAANLKDRSQNPNQPSKENLKFTNAQMDALNRYSGGEDSQYNEINDALRGKGSLDPSDLKSIIKPLDAAIAANSFPKDMTVYRGMEHPKMAADPQSYIGSTVSDKAYVSTSASRGVASDFKGDDGVLFAISVSKGSPALYIPSTGIGVGKTDTENIKGEKEWLLPRGTSYKITGYSGGVFQAQLIGKKKG
jgi:hypothetical protein